MKLDNQGMLNRFLTVVLKNQATPEISGFNFGKSKQMLKNLRATQFKLSLLTCIFHEEKTILYCLEKNSFWSCIPFFIGSRIERKNLWKSSFFQIQEPSLVVLYKKGCTKMTPKKPLEFLPHPPPLLSSVFEPF